MKKLLKSKVCETHEQCTGALFTAEKLKHAMGKKKMGKKRKRESANVDPNGYLVSEHDRALILNVFKSFFIFLFFIGHILKSLFNLNLLN